MAELSLGSNNPFRRKSSGPGVSAVPPPTVTLVSDADATVLFDGLAQQAPTPTTPASTPAPAAAGDQFRNRLQAQPASSLPLPQTSFQKPKVVKKVRVQSPPPSSPESAGGSESYAEWPTRPPVLNIREELGRGAGRGAEEGEEEDEDDGEDNGDGVDPFGNATALSSEDKDAGDDADALPSGISWKSSQSAQHHPETTFGRGLRGEEGEDASGRTRKSPAMDVNAFSRLLLTGHREDASATQASPHSTAPGDSGSITDASSISRQSMFDAAHPIGETPRTSHEISDMGEDEQHELIGKGDKRAHRLSSSGTLKKKPPPPSSRHGKLIRVQLQNKDGLPSPGQDGFARSPASMASQNFASPMPSPSRVRPSTPSDVNKPLPPAPGRPSLDDGSESIFDREAAGKVPELDNDRDASFVSLPRPPTPPNTLHATATPAPQAQAAKKPAPPPRRNHGRTDSKLSNPGAALSPGLGITTPGDENDSIRPRSSLDSTQSRSRSSSLRANIHAPAPPPPRRPNAAGRPSSTVASPSTPGFASIPSSGGERSPADPDRSPVYAALVGSLADAAAPAQVTPPSLEPSPGLGLSHNSSSTSLTTHAGHGLPKLSPPPPPPARSISVRSKRPASVSSFDATSRRVSKDKDSGPSGSHAPPPPPPRARGSSKSSVDGLSRRLSHDSVRILAGPVAEEAGEISGPESAAPTDGVVDRTVPAESSAANDILADLDALQREVEAAVRAQQGQS